MTTQRTEREKLLAEGLELRQELERVEGLYPRLVPFTGALPKTLEELENLPAPWQQQLTREHPEHLRDLTARERLKALAQAADEREARRREVLKDLSVQTAADFNALDPGERRKLVMAMTPEQRRAMAGLDPADKKPLGYL